MKLISSIMAAVGAQSGASTTAPSLNCTGPVFTVTCMPDFVIGVSVDNACLRSKYGLFPTQLEIGSATDIHGFHTCTACIANSCGSNVFYNDTDLTGEVSISDGAIYFQAGKCGAEMADDVDNNDNIIFSTQIGATAKTDEILGIVATNSISPVEFSCKYSRTLDNISYAPVGLTVMNITET